MVMLQDGVFGLLLIFICWWLGIAPSWYIIGGVVSILLGTTDDLRHVPWQIKLMVQLILATYITTIFWGRFEVITFYNLSFFVSQIVLLLIFLFWFIGIYNAINLLDGLDGLAVPHQTDWWDSETFLIDLGCVACVTTGAHATHIQMMPKGSTNRYQLGTGENRQEGLHVR